MIDTHSHLYLEEFDADRDAAVQRARDAGVSHIILPNVDADTLAPMKALQAAYPDYMDMAMGLHPTSVTANNNDFLHTVESELESGKYVAVGEVGLDLYWDSTFLEEQKTVFATQIEMAASRNLPVIVHTRSATPQLIEVLHSFSGKLPHMVFHSFTGTPEEVRAIRAEQGDATFYFGFNGIVTFKNSALAPTVQEVGINNILLETDCPYLAPVPHRGTRNESAYVAAVQAKVAAILGLSEQQVEEITDKNAEMLFSVSSK